MEVRNSRFSAFLDMFTPHTYLCVIMPDAYFSTELMKMNVGVAKKHFMRIENSETGEVAPTASASSRMR